MERGAETSWSRAVLIESNFFLANLQLDLGGNPDWPSPFVNNPGNVINSLSEGDLPCQSDFGEMAIRLQTVRAFICFRDNTVSCYLLSLI